MKIMETATFIFLFDRKGSKDTSREELQEFLMDNGWLTTEKVKIEPLNLYHTKENGLCEVVLAQDSTDDDFLDQIDDLFENLIKCEEVLWVKTIFNQNTDKIVHNNVDKYAQTFNVADMKYGDTVLVYIRK